MGCTQSKLENEEVVSRCKDRKLHMKDAVAARNLFAAAHSSHTMSLKNTGAALSDYAQGEAHLHLHHHNHHRSSQPSISQQPPIDSLPPPPPPLPDFSPAPPLLRSVSMPDIPLPKSHPKPAETILEEPEPEPTTPPLPLPLPPRSNRVEPPPEPEPRGNAWEFFFADVEGRPSLTQMEEMPPPHVEEEMNMYREEKFKREVEDDGNVEKTPEKVIVERQVKVNKKKQGNDNVGSSNSGIVDLEGSTRGKAAAAATNTMSLFQILTELDDHFLKASEGAHEVSKMLEANRMHYHSNFADNRGHIDHSARVMRVITWNRSFKNIPNGDDGKDDFYTDELETHATVLDKLLAWEKKLYDEVKAGELMKLEYQRKVTLLNKQKKRGSNPEALEKTKAAVSHLHTRYIVDMQSMDSTVSEIHRLRDDQLYPKLVDLVDGMAKMWETMHMHHDRQLKIVVDLRTLDISNATKETSDQHHNQTRQLCRILGEWNSQFQKLMIHQKEYIQALNSWLKLTLIPIESSLKEKVSSPPRVPCPPIQSLLRFWYEQLEKLPVELAKGAISSFAAVMESILMHQEEELKQKDKYEETKKDYMRKHRAFEEWHQKYLQRRLPALALEEADPERTEIETNANDPVAERQFVVDTLKKRLDDEMEAHQNLCKQVREKSLMSLKTQLPELFRTMSDFALVCSGTYKKLQSISKAEADGSSD